MSSSRDAIMKNKTQEDTRESVKLKTRGLPSTIKLLENYSQNEQWTARLSIPDKSSKNASQLDSKKQF